MTIEALLFMIFVFTFCLVGFMYSLFLSAKKK